eukprot:1643641-Pyramimonas_sp.AAC.1
MLYRVSRQQTAVCRAKWDPDMIVLTVTDAGWAGEGDVVKGRIEPVRSQRARANGLAGPGFIEGNSDHVHPR